MTSTIQEIHSAYCLATGFKIRLAYDREHAWYQFIKDGFTKDDLLLVIVWIQNEIKSERRREASLLFRNLIVQLDRFEEDLSMARSHARKPVKTARDHAMEQLRPSVKSNLLDSPPRSISHAAESALAELRKEKERIFGVS